MQHDATPHALGAAHHGRRPRKDGDLRGRPDAQPRQAGRRRGRLHVTATIIEGGLLFLLWYRGNGFLTGWPPTENRNAVRTSGARDFFAGRATQVVVGALVVNLRLSGCSVLLEEKWSAYWIIAQYFATCIFFIWLWWINSQYVKQTNTIVWEDCWNISTVFYKVKLFQRFGLKLPNSNCMLTSYEW